jgi:SAM-dependent methyltransferase
MHLFYPEGYHLDRNGAVWKKRYETQTLFLPDLKNEKILGIGCARGDFLKYLKEKNPDIRVYGVDMFSDHVDYENMDFYNMNFTDAGFDDSMFDIVTAWAVFEHLHTPGEYFHEVHRVLKKNGKLIILVTNSESLYGKRAYAEDVPRHLYHFSKKTLLKYAEKYNFHLAGVTYDDRIWDGRGMGTFYYLFQNLLGVTWEKRRVNKLNKMQKMAGKTGRIVDEIIFKTHWEAKIKRSGIIIAEFCKI